MAAVNVQLGAVHKGGVVVARRRDHAAQHGCGAGEGGAAGRGHAAAHCDGARARAAAGSARGRGRGGHGRHAPLQLIHVQHMQIVQAALAVPV